MEGVKDIECNICLENNYSINFIDCIICKQQWCTQCNKKIFKCPFCRKDLKELKEFKVPDQINDLLLADLLLLYMIINITINT
jgi:hypothetical protein